MSLSWHRNGKTYKTMQLMENFNHDSVAVLRSVRPCSASSAWKISLLRLTYYTDGVLNFVLPDDIHVGVMA